MRVAIAGAGAVGRSIAAELLQNGHQVLLIDADPKAIKIDTVPEAEWLLADACEIASLDEAGLADCHVVVAATGDDKVNLVVSLLAKTEYGVPRVVARINHPKNEWLFNESWGVDVAVSTPRLLSALVEEAVSVGDLVRLMTFRQGQANLVELTLPEDAPVVGRRTRRSSRSCARAGCSCRPRTTPWRPETSCCSWRTRRSSTSSPSCCRRADARRAGVPSAAGGRAPAPAGPPVRRRPAA